MSLATLPCLIHKKPPEQFKHHLTITSPVSGKLTELTDTGNLSFDAGIWGTGVRINTLSSRIISPFDAVVELVDTAYQRWIIRSKQGLKLMIQVGLHHHPTHAERLYSPVTIGEQIKSGDLICQYDPLCLKTSIGESYIIVSLMNRKNIKRILIKQMNKTIDAGTELFDIYV